MPVDLRVRGNGYKIGTRYIFNTNCYFLSRFGSRDCGFPIGDELQAFSVTRMTINPCGNTDVQEYLELVVEENALQWPGDWETATDL